MELEVLKKKISTYKSPSGRVCKLSNDLLYEILLAWENWTDSRSSFYSAIGVSYKEDRQPAPQNIINWQIL